MGEQPRIYYRYDGFYLPDRSAQPRGNNRFLLCRCGWLVQLNATGRAGARRTDYRDPTIACTNYECTDKKDHKYHRRRYIGNQVKYRTRIQAGAAKLDSFTEDLPPFTAPPSGIRLAVRYRKDASPWASLPEQMRVFL